MSSLYGRKQKPTIKGRCIPPQPDRAGANT
nr:MAG TPA: hypothetical protein [Caudoviricetes sp.]